MSAIEVQSLSLTLPIIGYNSQSLRKTILSFSTGGRLLKDKKDHVLIRALHNVTFKLQEGDRLGLIGHNGSGKSTLLRCLAGIYEPTRGTVSVHGKISSLIDLGVGLDVEATGKQNIRLLGKYRGISAKEIDDALPIIEEVSQLGAFLDLPVKTYSAGMLSRLMFAQAISWEPEVLLMDEWLGAGDAEFTRRAEGMVEKFVAKARVFVIASHSTSIIRQTCNKVLHLEKGEVVDFGDTDTVLDNYLAGTA